MKKLDFGQTLGLLANLGVLIGILLLVYELSQNREMMRAQTRAALSQSLMDMTFQLLVDDTVVDILYRGRLGEPLTDLERGRYRGLANIQFRYQENVHYQYRLGLYDDEEFAAQRETWKEQVYRNKGLVEVWCTKTARYSPEFEAEINSLLTIHKCE